MKVALRLLCIHSRTSVAVLLVRDMVGKMNDCSVSNDSGSSQVLLCERGVCCVCDAVD